MEIGAILSTAINIIITAAIGIISYFVKRTIGRQDKYVTRSELENYIDMIKECKGDIKSPTAPLLRDTDAVRRQRLLQAIRRRLKQNKSR